MSIFYSYINTKFFFIL